MCDDWQKPGTFPAAMPPGSCNGGSLPHRRPFTVVVEGNIGSGKTTFLDRSEPMSYRVHAVQKILLTPGLRKESGTWWRFTQNRWKSGGTSKVHQRQ